MAALQQCAGIFSFCCHDSRAPAIVIEQAYFCATYACLLGHLCHFGDLLFIHALTNATAHDHKYSLFPSADFDIAKVLVSFSAFIFS